MSTIADRLLNLYNKMVIANSVTNEFTQALPDCYEAVEAKGGTIPAEPTAANLPDAIESIPSGGGVVIGSVTVGLFRYITTYENIGAEFITFISSFSFDSLAYGSTSIKKIDLHNAIINGVISWWMRFMFYNCQSLEEVDLRFASIPMPTSAYNGSWLYNTNNLKIIRVGSWAIYGIDITAAGAMNRESIVQFLTDLPTPADSSQVITMGAAKLALLSSDDIAIATDKGWTLA